MVYGIRDNGSDRNIKIIKKSYREKVPIHGSFLSLGH